MKKLSIACLLIILALSVLWSTPRAERCCIEFRGNADGDQGDQTDIADLTFMVDYLFGGGIEPQCPDEADVDASDQIDVSDLTYFVSYLFGGGLAPAECPLVAADTVIQPLAIGNEWITDVVEYNQDGQIIAQYNATGTVVGDTIIDSNTWYFLQADTAGADISLWTNKDDGAWMWTDSAGMPQALMLMYPASAGTSYPLYDVSVTIESVNAVVTVPAGTFTCYYYRVHIPIFGTVGKVWAAPNIGTVRAEEYGLSLFGTYLAREVELLSYSLVTQ